MKSMRSLALLGCALLAAPSYAQTFSNNWWFTDIYGQTIGGVVSGLHNGDNLSAEGLTITITQSPFADLLGDYTIDQSLDWSGFDQYSATDGLVTFANFQYANGNDAKVWFGTDLRFTYYPELASQDYGELTYNSQGTTQFSVVAARAVPEPVSWALMVAGFGLAGMAMRNRRRAALSFG